MGKLNPGKLYKEVDEFFFIGYYNIVYMSGIYVLEKWLVLTTTNLSTLMISAVIPALEIKTCC